MSSNKIVVAKDGFDAETETDPNNLVFSSDYNTLKYFMSGTNDLSVNNNHTQVVIPHNLGYTPFFTCSIGLAGGGAGYAQAPYNVDGDGHTRYGGAFVDSTNLYLTLRSDINISLTYAWKIFKNNLGF